MVRKRKVFIARRAMVMSDSRIFASQPLLRCQRLAWAPEGWKKSEIHGLCTLQCCRRAKDASVADEAARSGAHNNARPTRRQADIKYHKLMTFAWSVVIGNQWILRSSTVMDASLPSRQLSLNSHLPLASGHLDTAGVRSNIYQLGGS